MSPQAAAVRCCCLSLVPVTAEHLHHFLRSSYETSCLLADIRASFSHYKEIFIPVPRANACSNFLIIWDFHASSCDLAGPIMGAFLKAASLTDRCVSAPGVAVPSSHRQELEQTSSWNVIFVPSGASFFSEESDTQLIFPKIKESRCSLLRHQEKRSSPANEMNKLSWNSGQERLHT